MTIDVTLFTDPEDQDMVASWESLVDSDEAMELISEEGCDFSKHIYVQDGGFYDGIEVKGMLEEHPYLDPKPMIPDFKKALKICKRLIDEDVENADVLAEDLSDMISMLEKCVKKKMKVRLYMA